MNKKAYITPATDIVCLKTESFIAASELTGTNQEGLGVSNEEYEDEGRSRRRGHSVWDDDDF